jgi:E3 ubiquitin-protein ligase UBR4
MQLSASSFLAADKGKDDKGKSPNKLREGSSRINLMKVLVDFLFSVPFMSDFNVWLKIQ